jgi:hypothetical protein
MKAIREERMPYLLASCDASGRRYFVCKLDKSAAGYVRQNAEGQWEIEDQDDPHFPAFAARDEAALFLYMNGRSYRTKVSIPEPIQIWVSPNFGQWRNCQLGQWVASLHREDGRAAGMNRCSVSLAETKILGIQQATNVPREQACQLAESSVWQETDL